VLASHRLLALDQFQLVDEGLHSHRGSGALPPGSPLLRWRHLCYLGLPTPGSVFGMTACSISLDSGKRHESGWAAAFLAQQIFTFYSSQSTDDPGLSHSSYDRGCDAMIVSSWWHDKGCFGLRWDSFCQERREQPNQNQLACSAHQ
jgi:hypothetical protein